jgi:hypothetical protein
MKRNLRSVVVSTSVLAITGGVLAATIGTAAAATTPPWETGNANQIGTLAFFDSAGVQITSGTDDHHIADYVLASTPDPSTKKGTLAELEFANPQNIPIATWAVHQDEQTPTPNTTAGTPPNLLNNPNPVVTLDSGGGDLFDAAGGFDQTSNPVAGEANVFQERVFTSGGGGGTTAKTYWSADILVNPANNSWTQVFGSPVSTTTTVGSSPSSAQGSPATLTATVVDADGSAPAGTITFTDPDVSPALALGSTSTFTAGGVASVTTSALPQGASDTIVATFVPANSGATTFVGSSGTGSQTVTAPATQTTTSVNLSGDFTHNGSSVVDATISGAVTPAAPGGAVGSVSLFDNTSTSPLNSTPLPIDGTGANTYSFTVPAPGLPVGNNTITAKFTPTNAADFTVSQGSTSSFQVTLSGGVCANEAASTPNADCTDPQGVRAQIPTGTLVISTPYTAANPLDLGTLALNSSGTAWTGEKAFTCITVTDTDGVNTGFAAQAESGSLVNTAAPMAGYTNEISGQDVGLTGLAPSPTTETCDGGPAVNNYTGGPSSIHATDNPAAAGVQFTDPGFLGLGNEAHPVLTGAANGVGTATYDGTLTLNAPTTSEPGTYNGTITFTVSDGD